MNKTDQKTAIDKTDEVTLKELILKIQGWWRFLLFKWKVILLAGVIGGALGLTYALLLKPVYKAELSFAVEDEKSSGGGLGAAMGLASQFGIDLGGSDAGGVFSGDNLLKLMKSRSMVENTLLTPVNIAGKRQTLADFYIDFNDLHSKWVNKPGLNHIQFLPDVNRSTFILQQDSVLGVFYKAITMDNLTVDKVDKNLSIITVQVKSESELFSKYFTEVLVKTVSDFYVNTKTRKSSQNVNILQRQTDSVRRELNAALTGVASSTDVNPNANPSLQILRVPSQRRQVDVQANQAILTQLVANLELSKVSLRKETPLIQVIDRPILPLEKEKFGKLKGIVLGGVIAVLLIVTSITLKKITKEILS